MTWQNQQNEWVPSEDSDQPGHPPSLIWVFAVRMKKAWVLSYPLSIQRRLTRLGGCPGWSESSLGAHSFCWFCHVVAQFVKPSFSLSHVMRKPVLAICEQQRCRSACSYVESDQHLCCSLSRLYDSIIPILAKSKISRLQLASEAEQAGSSLIWLHTSEDRFSHDSSFLI